MKSAAKQRLNQQFQERRQSNAPAHEGASNWAISYGDMITLLLAFFVLFFNINPQQSNDFNILVNLLESEFNDVTDEQTIRVPSAVWGVPTQSTQGEYAQISPLLKNKFESAITVEKNRMIVEFPNVSFFTSSSYQLTKDGVSALERFAGIFKGFTGEMRLIVRGYTDNRPVKSKAHRYFKDNLELSALRAISALRVLESKGVPFKLMRIGGYGETDKSPDKSDKKIMSYDRKVVLVVEPLDETERGFSRFPEKQNPKNELEKQGESV